MFQILPHYLVAILVLGLFAFEKPNASPKGGILAGERLRVFVTSDIGGGDFDDHQSFIHMAVYLDMFDLEGIL